MPPAMQAQPTSYPPSRMSCSRQQTCTFVVLVAAMLAMPTSSLEPEVSGAGVAMQWAYMGGSCRRKRPHIVIPCPAYEGGCPGPYTLHRHPCIASGRLHQHCRQQRRQPGSRARCARMLHCDCNHARLGGNARCPIVFQTAHGKDATVGSTGQKITLDHLGPMIGEVAQAGFRGESVR